jgi:hypothetical protein
VDGVERGVRHPYLALAARDPEAVADVLLRLHAREPVEVVARGHALGELAEVAPREQLAQLRLPEQDDLDQLLGVGLQVRDEADLLEHLRGEGLGLVDQEDDVPARRPRLQQERVELVHEVLERRARRLYVEVLEDRAQELGGGEGRIHDDGGGGVVGELAQEVAGERRLARPHLAGEQDEPAALALPELEVGEGLGVPSREVEILGVGGEVERLLGEAVPGFVHARRSCSLGRVYHPRPRVRSAAMLEPWRRSGSGRRAGR